MVRVLGGFQTDFSRNWTREGKHIVAPMKEAINETLASTRMDASEIETIHVGNFAGELYAMQGHLGALTLEADPQFRGRPTARHEAACASGGVALIAASAEIDAGRYRTALVLGVEQMKTVNAEQGGDYLGTAAWYEREAKGKDFPFPRLFGQLGAEYVHRFEIPIEDHQAYLADLMYRNARNNPKAQTRGWAMDQRHAATEDKFNVRLSPEIKLSDCSQVTDGAAAVVLVSEEYAEEYARKHGIPLDEIPALLGWGHTTAPIRLVDKLEESKNDKYVLPHSHRAITSAYARAGISGPEQLDACEFHDCFTTTAYAAIDLVGLTEPGENYKAIEEGWLEMEGKLPLNPSGGLIGAGHPVGATGVRQVLDAYRLVTGQAEDYQVPQKHHRVLTVNVGGSGTTTVAFVVGRG